jgi:excisionase family DNA binding protein
VRQTHTAYADYEDERQARPMKVAGPLERRLLDIREVAAYTGLATKTLYTMVSQRRIPFVKLGRLTKFDREELDRWINLHSVKPNRTIDNLT